ncbi:MAG: hypothetical protein KC910_00990 [Candidatus Eremiobacteraeota bacterium]|nr:hypothetical protein [Candidatus Eremiobacteraeota bacterium]
MHLERIDAAASLRARASRELPLAQQAQASLQAEENFLTDFIANDRFSRSMQSVCHRRFDQDQAILKKPPAWKGWQVSLASLGAGAALSAGLSHLPGVAPWVPGLTLAIGFYGAIVGPSNYRDIVNSWVRPAQFDKAVLKTARHDLDEVKQSLEVTRQAIARHQAVLAMTEAELLAQSKSGEAPRAEIKVDDDFIQVNDFRVDIRQD